MKFGKRSRDQITADVLKEVPSDCLEKLARSLSEMCWDKLPGGVDVLLDGNGTKGCGCNEPNQVQGDRCFCVRCEKSWATFGSVRSSTTVRKCADGVCAEDARRCLFVLLLKAAELSR